jgi:hypothetical protein
MPRYTDHKGLVITTSSALAAARYASGVELLFGSSPDAVAMLRAAVDADPAFGVALAALAWGSSGQADADAALIDALAASVAESSSVTVTRRERQHIEIVVTVLRGDRARARALGSEHLREFPADALVAHIITN